MSPIIPGLIRCQHCQRPSFAPWVPCSCGAAPADTADARALRSSSDGWRGPHPVGTLYAGGPAPQAAPTIARCQNCGTDYTTPGACPDCWFTPAPEGQVPLGVRAVRQTAHRSRRPWPADRPGPQGTEAAAIDQALTDMVLHDRVGPLDTMMPRRPGSGRSGDPEPLRAPPAPYDFDPAREQSNLIIVWCPSMAPSGNRAYNKLDYGADGTLLSRPGREQQDRAMKAAERERAAHWKHPTIDQLRPDDLHWETERKARARWSGFPWRWPLTLRRTKR